MDNPIVSLETNLVKAVETDTRTVRLPPSVPSFELAGEGDESGGDLVVVA